MLCCEEEARASPGFGPLEVSDDHGGSAWTLVSEAAFGAPGVMTVAALVTAQSGVCASYFDFVAAAIVAHAGISSRLAPPALALLSLLSLVRPLRSVSWLSTAGLATYVYVIALLLYFGPTHEPRTEPQVAEPRFRRVVRPSPFAFEGMGTALSIYASMGSMDLPLLPSRSAAYACAVCVYGFTAVFGYAVWGDASRRCSCACRTPTACHALRPPAAAARRCHAAASARRSCSTRSPTRRSLSPRRCALVHPRPHLLPADDACLPARRARTRPIPRLLAHSTRPSWPGRHRRRRPTEHGADDLFTGSVAFATIGFSSLARSTSLPPNRSCHDAIVSYLLVLLGVVGGGFGVYSTFAAGVQPG